MEKDNVAVALDRDDYVSTIKNIFNDENIYVVSAIKNLAKRIEDKLNTYLKAWRDANYKAQKNIILYFLMINRFLVRTNYQRYISLAIYTES